MALGPCVRQLLGPRLAQTAGGIYKSFFLNMRAFAEVLSETVAHGASVLDVGAGDGALWNELSVLRPDLKPTLLDPNPVVGAFLNPRHRLNARCLGGMSVEQYVTAYEPVDAVFLSDVLHHVPAAQRASLIQAAGRALRPGGQFIVKEWAPGGFKSWLGWCADRYISGDRGVSLLSEPQVQSLVCQNLGVPPGQPTRLFQLDPPNYALVFKCGVR